MEVTWVGIGARETYRSKVDIFNSSRSTELAHKFLLLAFVENSADILFKVVVKKLAIQFLKRATLEWIKHFSAQFLLATLQKIAIFPHMTKLKLC